MPKDQGGVVDPHCKVRPFSVSPAAVPLMVDRVPRQVYGTSNLRVVDLSILPVITAVHTQATTYALAEQGAHCHSLSFIWDVLLTPGCSLFCCVAADIIKADHGI